MFSPWRTPRGTSGPRSPPGGLPRALCGGRARTRRTGREVERAGARRSKPCPIRRACSRMQRGGRRRRSRDRSGPLSLGAPAAGLGECQDAHRVRYGAVLGRRESTHEVVFPLESELDGDRLPEGRPKIPVRYQGLLSSVSSHARESRAASTPCQENSFEVQRKSSNGRQGRFTGLSASHRRAARPVRARDGAHARKHPKTANVESITR